MESSADSFSDSQQRRKTPAPKRPVTQGRKALNSIIMEQEVEDSADVVMHSAASLSDYSSDDTKSKLLKNQSKPLVQAKNGYDGACQKL